MFEPPKFNKKMIPKSPSAGRRDFARVKGARGKGYFGMKSGEAGNDRLRFLLGEGLRERATGFAYLFFLVSHILWFWGGFLSLDGILFQKWVLLFLWGGLLLALMLTLIF